MQWMCFLWGQSRIIIREETSKIATEQSKYKIIWDSVIMWEIGHWEICGGIDGFQLNLRQEMKHKLLTRRWCASSYQGSPKKDNEHRAPVGQRAHEMLGHWGGYRKLDWKHVQGHPAFLPGMCMLFPALILKKDNLELVKEMQLKW